MAESNPSRQPIDPRIDPRGDAQTAAHPKGKGDSHLRIVSPDHAFDIFDDGPQTDESPTIISKKNPSSHQPTAKPQQQAEVMGGSLRGRRLAHFELIAPIGVGGMAAVIKARDTLLDRFVALKILPPEMANDPENVRRFHQEARAAAKLDHENVARVFFCGEDQKLHFIAFEFVEGENLRVLLERRGRLPAPEAIRYILQIATGLDHASSRGVVHRDIKPSNIIISSNGRAKLVDMGLARSMEPQTDQLTQSGMTLGTFDYISPEQALEPREADARSDIYSLGCTLYHMLTGQPPVPEGTAAKKLHHHQHVPPIDPRQLNPDIPDELAAILMRMMAKDPKNRYQKPVQLIQHLMQLAQKLGAGDGVPAGALFLEAPLPGAPRPRIGLTVALAGLALGVVLLVASMTSTPKPHLDIPLPGSMANQDPGKKDPPIIPEKNKSLATPTASSQVITTADKLRQALADPQKSTIVVEGRIELPREGLAFHDARNLVIRSSDTGATLYYRYQPAKDEPTTSTAALKLEDGTIRFENIRFEIEAAKTPMRPVAMIALEGASRVRFKGCTFTQKNLPMHSFLDKDKQAGRVPLSSVLVDHLGEERPRVNFDECFWQTGQSAVTLHVPAEIEARNCAFGPHGALFHLRGDSRDSSVQMERCSAFVVYGPAFRIDEQASCHIKVNYSIITCPDAAPLDMQGLEKPLEHDEPQLLRQTEATEPLVRFEGLRNRYYNLSAFWVWPQKEDGFFHTIDKFDDFARQVQESEGREVDSLVLSQDPFPSNALQVLAAKPQQAFQPRNLPDLRQKGTDKALGIEKCVWGDMKALPKFALKANQKVIDPAGEDQAPNVFRSLSRALPYVNPGDEILVKHGPTSREVEIKNPPLDESDLDLTIKPYPGYHPILVQSDKSAQKTSLFRLGNGKLTLENLEILLEPDPSDIKAQAVIAFAGLGQATLKNCVVTLIQGEKRVPLSLGVVLETEQEERQPASLTLLDSLVRGEGDLLLFRYSRPFKLEAKNSLVAIGGSFLSMQGGSVAVPAEPAVHLDLYKVTAFCQDPFVWLRGRKNVSNLALTRGDAIKQCLFVGLHEKSERPFISLEGIDANMDTLGQHLTWQAEKNAFVHWDRLLEVQRPDDVAPSIKLDGPGWRMWERDADFRIAKFALPPLSLRPLSQMTLDHFKAKAEYREELTPFGASMEPTLLPPFASPRKLDGSGAPGSD